MILSWEEGAALALAQAGAIFGRGSHHFHMLATIFTGLSPVPADGLKRAVGRSRSISGGKRTSHAPNARAASAIIVRKAPSATSSAKSRSVSTATLCIMASLITIRARYVPFMFVSTD
jgi:hypothetical protein